MSVVYSSFPRTREPRNPRIQAFAPCSGQGQALDPRFRGGDGNSLETLAPFSVGALLSRYDAKISPSLWIELSTCSCGSPGHWQRMMK